MVTDAHPGLWHPAKNEEFLVAMMDEAGFLRALATASGMLLMYIKALALDSGMARAPVLFQLICTLVVYSLVICFSFFRGCKL